MEIVSISLTDKGETGSALGLFLRDGDTICVTNSLHMIVSGMAASGSTSAQW
jgi:hypothetical protein